MPSFCTSCGHSVETTHKFCMHCGAPPFQSQPPRKEWKADQRQEPNGKLTFSHAVQRGFAKTFIKSGRASRAEYWWWILFCFGGQAIFAILGSKLPMMELFGFLFQLVIVIPSLTLGIRRLHDINKSGWWILLWMGMFFLIPVIVLIIWALQKGSEGANPYGAKPN